MTTLTVEPPALSAYADQVDRVRFDSTVINGYIAKNAEGGTGGELFSFAQEGNLQALQTIENTFTRLQCLLEASAPELRSAAAYYRETVHAAATSLDQALPSNLGQCPTALEQEIAANACEPGLFRDSRAPENHLLPPGEPPNSPNKFAFMDYISPASWLMKGLDVIFGFDPIAELQNKMFGDWEIFAKMPEVLANASAALHDTAANLQSGATQLGDRWQGNAGGSAYQYFSNLATAMDGIRPSLEEIGRSYRTMSDAVWAAGEAIGGTLKAMIDAAIISAMAFYAGTATAASGVGLGVGYTLAAVQAANVLKLWADTMKFVQNANAAIMAFRAALNQGLSDLESVEMPVLGGGAGYDHPLAGAGARA
ncbi:hypothetical protein OHA21_35485 [Actinoplanes sp. NBC_00393]|uniref:WXG100 family type VII secretion target n=1 Tax=Actinoplanes sp. NBC_00393 TaxID=2975953 RepID=UPI002E240BBA